MGDDGVYDVGDDALSCPGRYYCFSPALLPTRRELKLNCLGVNGVCSDTTDTKIHTVLI